MTERTDRGSALLILLLLSFTLVVTATALITHEIEVLQDQTQKRLLVKARYEALGHLAAAEHQVEANPTLLETYADSGDPIPETTVLVTSVVGASDVYEMSAKVEYDDIDKDFPVGVTLKEGAVVTKGSDIGLAKYAILSGEGMVEYFQQLYKPSKGIGGDLWANVMLFGRVDDLDGHVSEFGPPLPGGWIIEDSIWDWENWFHNDYEIPPLWLPGRANAFMAPQNIQPRDVIDPINFGDIGSVTDLAGEADHAYTKDITVEFKGDQVIVTPDGDPPETYSVGDVDIIYTDGTITSIEGSLNGTITVASNGGVTITGNVVYVDGGGDKAMSGGDGVGDYVPNPAYGGDSTLGVYTEGNIIIGDSVPSNTELNGLYFTRNGNIVIDGYKFGQLNDPYKDSWSDGNLPVEYTGSFGIRDSLRIFGSLQYENFFLPYSFDIHRLFTADFPLPPVPADHRYKDRKFIYDQRLKDAPPPGYGGGGVSGAVFLGKFPLKQE